MNDKKCQHQQCHCTGNEIRSDGYCSDACRDGKSEDGKCACGHPACRE
jgi:hypothetical protein